MSGFKELWPAALALLLAAGLAGLAEQRTRAQRLTNLDLANPGLPDTYLAFSPTERDRCDVVGRSGATTNRGERGPPGSWQCLRIRGARGGESWLVRAKRRGTGAVFLVAAREVPDWTFPFLYAFVREREQDAELPWVGWTQLFASRVYQGLYLRVALPFDPRKRDGGSGLRRELLAVRDDELLVVDTRFDDADHLYVSRVAAGALPELEPPSEALAWLARRRPTPELTLLLSDRPPHAVSLLPLPVSVWDLYERTWGRPPRLRADADYRVWTEAPWARRDGAAPPFSGAELAALEGAFEAYAEALRRALRVDAELHGSLAETRRIARARQGAVADLGLGLGEF